MANIIQRDQLDDAGLIKKTVVSIVDLDATPVAIGTFPAASSFIFTIVEPNTDNATFHITSAFDFISGDIEFDLFGEANVSSVESPDHTFTLTIGTGAVVLVLAFASGGSATLKSNSGTLTGTTSVRYITFTP